MGMGKGDIRMTLVADKDTPPLVDESIPHTVYQMVAEVTHRLCALGGVKKGQTNTFDKYQFRGIDQVYDALAPILSDVGLVIIPKLQSKESEIRQSKKGDSLNFVNVIVEFDLVSSADGSKCSAVFPGEGMDRSDKATSKAMTAAYKYMCFEVFCIPFDVPDADAETPELGSAQFAKEVEQLESCKDLPELQAVWTGLSVEARKALEGVKERMKADLS